MGLTHHDGVSVYESGLYWGKKNVEVPYFGTGVRADAGTTGGSGMILSVSTRLSTITNVVASPKYSASGLYMSGKITAVAVNWTNHTMDFQLGYHNTSAGVMPAASGVISWVAFGV